MNSSDSLWAIWLDQRCYTDFLEEHLCWINTKLIHIRFHSSSKLKLDARLGEGQRPYLYIFPFRRESRSGVDLRVFFACSASQNVPGVKPVFSPVSSSPPPALLSPRGTSCRVPDSFSTSWLQCSRACSLWSSTSREGKAWRRTRLFPLSLFSFLALSYIQYGSMKCTKKKKRNACIIQTVQSQELKRLHAG